MKKKILGAAVLALAAALGAWIFFFPKALGNINKSCNLPETGNARISFPAEAGERFRVRFTTDAGSGTVELLLLDAWGNLVEDLGQAKQMETWVILPEAGEYILEARYEAFTGRFQVKIYS